MLLKVEALAFSYNERVIFSNLNFALAPGQLMLVSGQNGAGKSTLLSILAGLLPTKKGTFTSCPLAYLQADTNGHFLDLSAEANLRFWLNLCGILPESKMLQSMLADWGLNSTYINQNLALKFYSTGMKRRLALARVAALKRPLWILDEPLLGLDDRGVKTFAERLDSHLTEGGLAVIVAHDWAAHKLRQPDVSLVLSMN